MNQFIHKIGGVNDKTSLHVVIPHPIIEEMGITRGDFVQIGRKDTEIVIRKLLAAEKSEPNRNKNTIVITGHAESSDSITHRLISKGGTVDTGISAVPQFTKQV